MCIIFALPDLFDDQIFNPSDTFSHPKYYCLPQKINTSPFSVDYRALHGSTKLVFLPTGR